MGKRTIDKDVKTYVVGDRDVLEFESLLLAPQHTEMIPVPFIVRGRTPPS